MKCVVYLSAILLIASAITFGQQTRTIAVTIDDLPVVSTRTDLKNRQEITKKLVGHIVKAKVPAIGFVNEGKLFVKGERDEKQVDLLRVWVNAGLELGNHTFEHKGLHQNSVETYRDGILKGDAITNELLAKKGKKVRYFRHPYLHTGRTLEIKAQIDEILKEKDYTIAPVTIDNADYIFSKAYDVAFDRGDKQLMKKIGAAYLDYMEKKTEYWEKQSMRLYGREISQTLLLHANFINSDYFDDLVKMYKKRGYRFVSIEDALKDELYRQPDTFTGFAGISWLHRWAIAKGKENIEPNEPLTPEWVLKLSGFESE